MYFIIAFDAYLMTSVYRDTGSNIKLDESRPVIYTRLFIVGNRNAYGKRVEILMYAAFFLAANCLVNCAGD